ncbi:hypothetical protein ACOMHN_054232 [Nucella lapillus]
MSKRRSGSFFPLNARVTTVDRSPDAALVALVTRAITWTNQKESSCVHKPEQRPCSLASITTAAGRSTHCPGTLAFITAAAGWSTQRCPWTLALIIDIAAVS